MYSTVEMKNLAKFPFHIVWTITVRVVLCKVNFYLSKYFIGKVLIQKTIIFLLVIIIKVFSLVMYIIN